MHTISTHLLYIAIVYILFVMFVINCLHASYLYHYLPLQNICQIFQLPSIVAIQQSLLSIVVPTNPQHLEYTFVVRIPGPSALITNTAASSYLYWLCNQIFNPVLGLLGRLSGLEAVLLSLEGDRYVHLQRCLFRSSVITTRCE